MIEIESDNAQTSENQPKESFGVVNWILVLIGACILAFGAALLVTFVVSPYLANQKIEDKAPPTIQKRGPITASNTTVVIFNGQKLETATIDQKALALNNLQTDTAGFIFGNGDNSGNKKILEVFVDFNNQRSRDFMLINRSELQSFVESGSVELHVLPVPTGKAYGAYSAEAIAETFANKPESAWNLMFELLRRGLTVGTDDVNEVAEIVVETTEEATNSTFVTTETLRSGAFSSWLISGGNDSRLTNKFYPPLIYIDGQVIDVNAVNVNDPEEFYQAVMSNI